MSIIMMLYMFGAEPMVVNNSEVITESAKQIVIMKSIEEDNEVGNQIANGKEKSKRKQGVKAND